MIIISVDVWRLERDTFVQTDTGASSEADCCLIPDADYASFDTERQRVKLSRNR